MLSTSRDLANGAVLILAVLCHFQVNGFTYSEITCPVLTFPCPVTAECLDFEMINDGKIDCPDGTDEAYSSPNDTSQVLYLEQNFVKVTKARDTNCNIDYYPPNCWCSDVSVFCDRAQLTKIPSNLSVNTVVLILLKNKLRTFRSDAFAENNVLEILDLDYNELETLEPNIFERLTRLKILRLMFNRISKIEKGAFAKLTNLQILILEYNKITKIEKGSFVDLRNLKVLNLNYNRIKYIEPGSFLPLNSLQNLAIEENLLTELKEETFSGLGNVTFLLLSYNRIEIIAARAFKDLVNMQSLRILGNKFYHVPTNTFKYTKNLEYIHFRAFYLCAYATTVKTCLPKGDGISSHQNLLDSSLLRVAIWVMAILACIGNGVVLTGRLVLKEDNRIHSFLIRNLSLADLLMGVYLLVIGSYDTLYRGRYLANDHDWRNSWSCDVSGFLNTVSSEVSVLTLTVVTLDRYICVTYPLTLRKINIKLAYLIMGAVWLFSITLAAAPLVGIPYFSSYFYKHNAVCVPLLLHEPRNSGWEYSAFIFLGINFASVAFMTYAYVAMFVAIRGSCFRSLHQSQERCLMKRFFFIVVTDWACWLPIIALKIAALTGTKLSPNIYAWIVVFVLPVNSAINPLIYTLTTRIFRHKFLVTFTGMVWKGRTYQENSTSVSIIKSRSSRREDAEVERYPLQDESQINSWTDRMVVKYGQRRTVYPSSDTPKDLQIGYTSD
ncbi:relaxin receptor 1-like [Gigantopelta aegis]|uniref:relaxin receptor 1-like n=1 Tax=Gigantopelta aegis TaxID=1735272 RepID=UPI001B8875C0|nr:relaxin receptor 1-like [Gigantopelta aegis]